MATATPGSAARVTKKRNRRRTRSTPSSALSETRCSKEHPLKAVYFLATRTSSVLICRAMVEAGHQRRWRRLLITTTAALADASRPVCTWSSCIVSVSALHKHFCDRWPIGERETESNDRSSWIALFKDCILLKVCSGLNRTRLSGRTPSSLTKTNHAVLWTGPRSCHDLGPSHGKASAELVRRSCMSLLLSGLLNTIDLIGAGHTGRC